MRCTLKRATTSVASSHPRKSARLRALRKQHLVHMTATPTRELQHMCEQNRDKVIRASADVRINLIASITDPHDHSPMFGGENTTHVVM